MQCSWLPALWWWLPSWVTAFSRTRERAPTDTTMATTTPYPRPPPAPPSPPPRTQNTWSITTPLDPSEPGACLGPSASLQLSPGPASSCQDEAWAGKDFGIRPLQPVSQAHSASEARVLASLRYSSAKLRLLVPKKAPVSERSRKPLSEDSPTQMDLPA